MISNSSSKFGDRDWNRRLELENAHQEICDFFKDLVNKANSNEVIDNFQSLFINYHHHEFNHKLSPLIKKIVGNNEREKFLTILNQCSYIIVYRFLLNDPNSIQKLIDIFPEPGTSQGSGIKKQSTFVRRKINLWLSAFTNSNDYKTLYLFSHQVNNKQFPSWIYRYRYYLLVAESFKLTNSNEKKEASISMARKLKKEFKIKLAMHISIAQSNSNGKKTHAENPTLLGTELLDFIKLSYLDRSKIECQQKASIFKRQTQNISFINFKTALQKYLILMSDNEKLLDILKKDLFVQIDLLYSQHNQLSINKVLLLRTCNKIIDALTIENKESPTSLFIVLMSQGKPLNVTNIFLSLISISPNSLIHLENRLGQLIEYYQKEPKENSLWLVRFMEIFRVIFAIYGEPDVKFNLIKSKKNQNNKASKNGLSSYQVFLQYKK